MESKCLVCGAEIKKERSRHTKKLCSVKCAGQWKSLNSPIKYVEKECPNCNKTFKADYSQVKVGNYKYCSNKCRFEHMRGERVWNYSGGWVRPDGYRQVSIDSRMHLEHRAVMEKHIGRTLKTNEHVHHKDGNKLNNDIANLEIVISNEHARSHSIGKTHDKKAKDKMKLVAAKRKRNDRGEFIKN